MNKILNSFFQGHWSSWELKNDLSIVWCPDHQDLHFRCASLEENRCSYSESPWAAGAPLRVAKSGWQGTSPELRLIKILLNSFRMVCTVMSQFPGCPHAAQVWLQAERCKSASLWKQSKPWIHWCGQRWDHRERDKWQHLFMVGLGQGRGNARHEGFPLCSCLCANFLPAALTRVRNALRDSRCCCWRCSCCSWCPAEVAACFWRKAHGQLWGIQLWKLN